MKNTETAIQEFMESSENFVSEDNLEAAILYNYRGLIYTTFGYFEKGEKLYLKSLNIFQYLLEPNNSYIANVMRNMGNLYLKMGNFFKAEALNFKSLNIWVSLFGENHPEIANSLLYIKELYEAIKTRRKEREAAIKADLFGKKALKVFWRFCGKIETFKTHNFRLVKAHTETKLWKFAKS